MYYVHLTTAVRACTYSCVRVAMEEMRRLLAQLEPKTYYDGAVTHGVSVYG